MYLMILQEPPFVCSFQLLTLLKLWSPTTECVRNTNTQVPLNEGPYYYGPSEEDERAQRRALYASRAGLSADLKLKRLSQRYVVAFLTRKLELIMSNPKFSRLLSQSIIFMEHAYR